MSDGVRLAQPRVAREQHLLWAILLIEGFVGLSVQVLTIRQLLPFAGNSVMITGAIIATFLAFLALGYHHGGRFTGDVARRLRINFFLAALGIGIGLSHLFLVLLFGGLEEMGVSTVAVLAVYLLAVTAPVVWLLGQTVPLATNLFPRDGVARVSGKALSLSTVGSFAGALVTAVVLLSYFGVGVTVFANSMLLIGLALWLVWRSRPALLGVASLFAAGLAVLIWMLNVEHERNALLGTNAYSSYELQEGFGSNGLPGKYLVINGSYSSFIGPGGSAGSYIEIMRDVLFGDLAFRNRDVLVLGAGGFTLSADRRARGNRFLYVDIDPELKEITEQHFLPEIRGEFVAQDARVYARTAERSFDAVVVDAFSSRNAIPFHLLTVEHFADVNGLLDDDGVALINVIANPRLEDDYSRSVDATLRAAFAGCMARPLSYEDDIANIVYLCRKRRREDARPEPYTDARSSAQIDYHFLE